MDDIDVEKKLDLILNRLDELEKKIEDSNNILKSNRRAERWGKFFSLIKWIIIVSIGIVAWSYIQPIYTSTMDTYTSLIEKNEELQKNFKEVTDLKDKLNKYTDKLPNFLK